LVANNSVKLGRAREVKGWDVLVGTASDAELRGNLF